MKEKQETTANETMVETQAQDAKNMQIERQQAIDNMIEQSNKFNKGTLMLEVPIRAEDKDVKELRYNFTKLTGWEYAAAMDTDPAGGNVFNISTKQALTLFAKAAAKETKGIDDIDIRERISIQDSVKAVQLAALFFFATTREGEKRITSGL
jgi:hypothetical protein